jgi:hypothetical protein
MALAAQFRSAVLEALRQETAGKDLLPLLLAKACVRVLPVDGAGLSVTDTLRVPLAASDDMVAQAERLQTTLGEGPCLAAARTEPLAANATTMAVRWPVFHQELIRQTTYRSVASVPLRFLQERNVGALDLYSHDPHTLGPALLEEISTDVADPIATILFAPALGDSGDDTTTQGLLSSENVAERMNVWVAVGMLMQRLGLANGDALAVLRGYAYGQQSSLDEVARQVTSKQLEPNALLAE